MPTSSHVGSPNWISRNNSSPSQMVRIRECVTVPGCCCMPLLHNYLMDSCSYVCRNTLLAAKGGSICTPLPPPPPLKSATRYYQPCLFFVCRESHFGWSPCSSVWKAWLKVHSVNMTPSPCTFCTTLWKDCWSLTCEVYSRLSCVVEAALHVV